MIRFAVPLRAYDTPYTLNTPVKNWSDRFNARFTWNYVAQKILGKQVRRKVQLQASASRRLSSSNIHDKPVSSWCNTVLAPPVVTSKAGGDSR